LLSSSRGLEDVIYREESDAMANHDPDLRVVNILTRKQRRDGRAPGEGSIRGCWPTLAFRLGRTQRFLFVDPLLSWRQSQAFWWRLDTTLSRSRRNALDPRERRHD